MASRLPAILLVAATGIISAGCSMMPFGWGDDEARARHPRMVAARPAPAPASPTGAVTAQPLPPPGGIGAPGGETSMASLAPATGSATGPAGGNVTVARTDVIGGWTLNAAGDSCQLFMTLTTWSGGYRASTRGCNNPALKTISAWNLEGGQVQLLNDSGATVARLYASSKTQFSGQTNGGGPISVFRT